MLIDKNIESKEPVFENNTMIAVKSNNLKFNTVVGSYVIIPKSQVGSPFELSYEEWEDSRLLLLEVKEYLDKRYKPDVYNIWCNVGKVA